MPHIPTCALRTSMDSFNFHFERVRNLDLHPLSCPVSRLSPAKSTSSIDQFTHHHGKGDSAYSSFSGGSNAPDYSSPFLPDEITPHSLQYTDLKYVKAVYHPNDLNSGARSMDQIYRSMEAISQQYHHHDSFLGVYGRRGSQPSLTDSVSRDEVDQVPEQQKPASTISRSPPNFIAQESLKQQAGGGSGQMEGQRQRPHLAQEPPLPRITQHGAQNVINGNIQHKGQFYFVTGVCKPLEPGFKDPICGMAEGEELQCSVEDPHRLSEKKERSHSTFEDLLRNVRHRRQSSQEAQSEREAFHQSQDFKARNQYKELHSGPSPISDQGSQSFDGFDENSQNAQSREIGLGSRRHHSSSHHIFYCGPEDGTPLANSVTKDTVLPLPSLEKRKRQSFGGVAKEKISKENTPLLYHLTGESRGALAHRPKIDNDANGNWKASRQNSPALRWQSKEGPTHREERTSSSGSAMLGETPMEEIQGQATTVVNSSNALDDSFKKYYKEKLKDAQSKVLRETSFKRKDLQLSWPHRIRQNPEQRPSVLHSASSSRYSSLTSESPIPTESEVLGKKSDKESGRESGGESEKESSKVSEKENGRPPNLAQPQVPRIGGRKRLTAEQKKLCFSEPEKLHQLGEGPVHMMCRSLGNEKDGLLSREDLSEQGLVATRRKMFETRGRALSASSLSKATLKEIQHKALVAYMERKTGNKTAEPQQPVLLTPGQRHSTAGKPSDWGPRALSGNVGSRKKLFRPLSAGRILDSSSSSIRYSQFIHTRQCSWKDMEGSEKSASAESLLDQPEPPGFFRARSTSTPHAFKTESNSNEAAPEGTVQRASSPKKAEGEAPPGKTRAISVPEDQLVRVVAPRGKSMEELGVSRVSGPPILSKSSDQLDQLRSKQSGPVREKRGVSFFSEEEEKLQGHTRRKSLLKQDSAPQLCGREEVLGPSGGEDRVLSRDPNPDRTQSASLGSSSAVPFPADAVGNSLFYIDTPLPLPPPPCAWGSPGRESPAPPCPPKGPNESRANSRMKTPPPVHSLLSELTVENQDGIPRPDSSQEVSLSHGVTTDPSLWLVPQETCTPSRSSTSPGDDGSTKGAPNPPPERQASDPQAITVVMVAENSLSAESDSPGMQPQEEKEVEAGVTVGDTESPENTTGEAKPQWEELVKEVVAEDQSLVRVLCPVTNRKTAVMLMEQLLSEDTLLMEEHYRKKQARMSSSTQQAVDRSKTMEEAEKPIPPACENPGTDAQIQETGQTPNKTGSDVTEKKRLLMACIEGHLQTLEGQRACLQEELRVNGLRGGEVDTLVRDSCLPVEYERYALFVGDLERVVSLLLCLSARLARVQNALSTVDQNTDAEEKQSLDSRHGLLCKQREDAKDLKDNLDRRERVVSTFLSKHLTPEQLQDYRRFVQTKASLLIQQKDLDERQRLGEEQLESLLNSIPP
ncbi:hypothetical protein AAFF_G00246280 [Aldrovandia affinis]|uniref:Uncharacterized protein n=1 Tax=Aldrovandia affinis TaxID=143900 RepID=A0AAD7WTV3_9TELE|nr:hypothetical protein AAFF_G00246280 [Aldrovandia affinis]